MIEKQPDKTFCDICKKEALVINIQYPVIFLTEQTEGRGAKPHISHNRFDICEECASQIFMVVGYGAQGYNNYKLKEEQYKLADFEKEKK